MALPKLASAKYELTLPSNGEKVEFRPFLVKEEKILLMAQSQGTDKDQIMAIKDIVNNSANVISFCPTYTILVAYPTLIYNTVMLYIR